MFTGIKARSKLQGQSFETCKICQAIFHSIRTRRRHDLLKHSMSYSLFKVTKTHKIPHTEQRRKAKEYLQSKFPGFLEKPAAFYKTKPSASASDTTDPQTKVEPAFYTDPPTNVEPPTTPKTLGTPTNTTDPTTTPTSGSKRAAPTTTKSTPTSTTTTTNTTDPKPTSGSKRAAPTSTTLQPQLTDKLEMSDVDDPLATTPKRVKKTKRVKSSQRPTLNAEALDVQVIGGRAKYLRGGVNLKIPKIQKNSFLI